MAQYTITYVCGHTRTPKGEVKPHRRWAQKKDWSIYPWREVVEVRPLWQFGHHFIETLACGHDGRAMLYPWQQAKRRRCIQCPP